MMEFMFFAAEFAVPAYDGERDVGFRVWRQGWSGCFFRWSHDGASLGSKSLGSKSLG